MARLSDVIEQLIKDMIEAGDGETEITRGVLAEQVQCVPSQVTYVLRRRFTTDQGYRVESRRGGGGWIRIQRLSQQANQGAYLMHIVNALRDPISQQDADVHLRNLEGRGLLPGTVSCLMRAAICDRTLELLPIGLRSVLRREILRNMLLQYAIDGDTAEGGNAHVCQQEGGPELDF